MARIIALDYGEKRTGIAETDELQIIASGLTTVETVDLIPFLKTYFEQHKVEAVVIGLPRQMNYQPSESEALIQSFLNTFTKHFKEIPVIRIDERFTSKLAMQTMIDSGISKSKRRDKKLLDQISATLILQSYLDSR